MFLEQDRLWNHSLFTETALQVDLNRFDIEPGWVKGKSLETVEHVN